MINRNRIDVVVFVSLVLCAAAARLVPHWPNFTPLAAVSLFAGFWFARRSMALLVPLCAMLLSDMVIGGYEPAVMATVYVSLLLPIAFRGILRTRLSALRIGGTAIVSSIVFFLTTNFAHWLWMGNYSLTLAGLGECYAAALPFFKYQVMGDLMWSGGLFGAYAMAARSASTAPSHASESLSI